MEAGNNKKEARKNWKVRNLDGDLSGREFVKKLKTRRKTLKEEELIEPNHELQDGNTSQAEEVQEDEELILLLPEDENAEKTHKFELLPSNKDKNVLWIDENFKMHKKNVVRDKVYWRCVLPNCKATATTNKTDISEEIVGNLLQPHSHPGDHDGYVASKQRRLIKDIAKANPNKLPSDIIMESKKKLTSEELMSAATDEADLQTIGRIRREYNKIVNNPDSMALEITQQWRLTNDGERFLLYDSNEDLQENFKQEKQRVIIFASKECLKLLKENKNWTCDGSYDIRPNLIKDSGQVFIIGCFIGQHCIPCAYAILTGNNQILYKQIFAVILAKIGTHPNTIICDLERVKIDAARNVFTVGTIVYGSFSQFLQSLWINWSSLGLATLYAQNKNSRFAFRCMLALAFLPTELVRRGFFLILRITENHDAKLKNFFFYFAKTYLGLSNGESLKNFVPIGVNLDETITITENQNPAEAEKEPVENVDPSTNKNTTISTSVDGSVASNSLNTVTEIETGNSQTSRRYRSLEDSFEELDVSLQDADANQSKDASIVLQNINPAVEKPLYDLEIWNVGWQVTDGLAKTLNAIEVSHRSVQSNCPKLSSFTTFLSFLRDYNDDSLKCAQSINHQEPKKRRTKSMQIDDQIREVLKENKSLKNDTQLLKFMKKITYCTKQFVQFIDVDKAKNKADEEAVMDENEETK